MDRRRIVLLIAVLFGTGVLSLVYESCWIRLAGLAFGSTERALAVVVAVFFAGLAAGHQYFGRRAGRCTRPLRLFALAEAGVALCALLSPWLFDLAELVFGLAYPALERHPAGLQALRGALVAAVLVPPTVLMGAGLPLACQALVRADAGRTAGRLYAVNTAGAAAGVALAGFWLLPAWGTTNALHVGGLIGLGLAVLLLACRRSVPAAPVAAAEPSGVAKGGRAAAAWLFALVGFTGLAGEVLWTRFMALLFHNTVHSYTAVLCVVLAGIALGSLLAAPLARRRGACVAAFGLAQVLAAVAVPTLMLLPPAAWAALLGEGQTPRVLRTVLAFFPPAVCAGAAFPLAARLARGASEPGGPLAGRLLALNTAGGVAGSLATGFLLLPLLGLHRSLLLVSALGLVGGCLAWVLLSRRRLPALAAVVPAGAGWLVAVGLPETDLPRDHLVERGRLMAYREGRASNLAVVARDGRTELEIDGLWQGADEPTHQVLAGHLPALLHPRPRRALVIGLGAGQTARALLLHPLEELVIVDCEPALPGLVRSHFGGDWLDDPRVDLIAGDGHAHLAHGAGDYDLITIEVGQLFRPGAENFYTADCYRRARARLRAGGLVSQFVPIDSLEPDIFARVVASFVAVFPDATLWYNTAECLLVGAADEQASVDPTALAERLAEPAIRDDLAYAHWGGPAYNLNRVDVLLAGLLLDADGLRAVADDARPLRADRPVLSYRVDPHAPPRPEPVLDRIADRLAPVDALAPADDASLKRRRHIRRLHLGEIRATALRWHLPRLRRAGEHQRVRRRLQEALALNPESLVTRLGLARVHEGSGETAAAAAQYRAVLERDPENLTAHVNLGSLLAAGGRPDAALPHFQCAARLAPEAIDVQLNLATVWLALGHPDRAAAGFRELLRQRPGLPTAEHGLGHALLATGRREAAMTLYAKLVRHEDLPPLVAAKAARVLVDPAVVDARSAALALQFCARVDPASEDLADVDLLARVHAANGHDERVLELLRRGRDLAAAGGQEVWRRHFAELLERRR